MAYISNGRVVEKPTGFVAVLRSYIVALIAFFAFFFNSIFSPEVSGDAKKKDQDRSRRPGDGGPGGGPGRGPRITGLDKIGSGSHAAQCGGGG